MSEGIKESIKKRQYLWLFIGLSVLVGGLVLGLWISDPNTNRISLDELKAQNMRKLEQNYSGGSKSLVSAQDTWISKSEDKLKSIQLENEALKKQVSDMSKVLESINNKLDGGLPTSGAGTQIMYQDDMSLPPTSLPPPPVSQAKQAIVYDVSDSEGGVKEVVRKGAEKVADSLLPPAPNLREGKDTRNIYSNNQGMVSAVNQDETGDDILMIDIYKPSEIESESPLNIATALPVGSFATVGLLSGMDAPTGARAESNPVPIVLRVLDDGQLPNFFKSDVSDCQITGAGYGDISSERVYIRTEKMSCVLQNGDIAAKTLKGYITGEDGKAGLRGKVVEKQGAKLAMAFVAGTFGGIGSSLSSQYSEVSTSALGTISSVSADKAFENGVATGAGNALEKMADFYLQRASEMYPIIEIDAKRIGELVITETLDFETEIIGKTNQG